MTRKWGQAYGWVYRFLLLRDGATCYLCHQEKDEKGSTILWVEHKDNDATNPDPANLFLAHPSCNAKKNPPNQDFPQPLPNMSEREKKKIAQAQTNANLDLTNSAWEPKQSARMRYFYQQKLYHPETGIAVNQGWRTGIKGLASQLKDWAGFGESVTYRRYLDDDIAAGYFEFIAAEKNEIGVDLIERTGKLYPVERLGIKVRQGDFVLMKDGKPVPSGDSDISTKGNQE